MKICRVHRTGLWMFYLFFKSYWRSRGASIMSHVKWQVQSCHTAPSIQANCRKHPQDLSKFLLMQSPAKNTSFSWTWDMSFMKAILQMVNTIHLICCKYASLKALVIPRISVYFPAHLFSSKNVSRDITQTREPTPSNSWLLCRDITLNSLTHKQLTLEKELDGGMI